MDPEGLLLSPQELIMVHNQSQKNSNFIILFFKIHFDIILPYVPKILKLSN
jgi:hypothetical protein